MPNIPGVLTVARLSMALNSWNTIKFCKGRQTVKIVRAVSVASFSLEEGSTLCSTHLSIYCFCSVMTSLDAVFNGTNFFTVGPITVLILSYMPLMTNED